MTREEAAKILESIATTFDVSGACKEAYRMGAEELRRAAELEAERKELITRVETAHQVATAKVNRICELYPRAQCNPILNEAMARQQVWKHVLGMLNGDLTIPEVKE